MYLVEITCLCTLGVPPKMELNLHFFSGNARLSNLYEIQTSVLAIFHFGINLIHGMCFTGTGRTLVQNSEILPKTESRELCFFLHLNWVYPKIELNLHFFPGMLVCQISTKYKQVC